MDQSSKSNRGRLTGPFHQEKSDSSVRQRAETWGGHWWTEGGPRQLESSVLHLVDNLIYSRWKQICKWGRGESRAPTDRSRSWRVLLDRDRQNIYLPHRNTVRRNNSYKWMESLSATSSSSQSLSKVCRMLDLYSRHQDTVSSSHSEQSNSSQTLGYVLYCTVLYCIVLLNYFLLLNLATISVLVLMMYNLLIYSVAKIHITSHRHLLGGRVTPARRETSGSWRAL